MARRLSPSSFASRAAIPARDRCASRLSLPFCRSAPSHPNGCVFNANKDELKSMPEFKFSND
jgi:hypothetical protein